MKYQYAIYKTKDDRLYARLLIENEIQRKKYTPYIKAEYLPVVVNDYGGWCQLHDRGDDLIGYRETNSMKNPLSLEEEYQKNSDKFEYGWISPDGNTYMMDTYEHKNFADRWYETMGVYVDDEEQSLENIGWAKVTYDICSKQKVVFYTNRELTSAQNKVIHEKGLEDYLYDV